MSTINYQLFFIIGLSMERPYNSLELWPMTTEKGMPASDDLPILTTTARQIYEYKA